MNDTFATARGLIARGRRRAAVRLLAADGSEASALMLANLPPDGPGGTVLVERLRFGPPETWLAWRRDWGRVALKLSSTSDAGTKSAFRHPGVAPLLGCGHGWTATAWVGGPTLAAILRQGPLAPSIHEGITEAVAALHAAGLAHGDLTPANIVLSERGPVLIDWGEPCAGTPGWRPEGGTASPAERDAFAIDRLHRLVGA